MTVASGTLTDSQRERYSRHLVLAEIGDEGQQRLAGARVAVVGVGGLGSPVGMYLAAAGVGHLTLIDHDIVDTSNLQRQVVHGELAQGRPKVDAAAERLRDLNGDADITTRNVRIDRGNALDLLREHDVVIDGSDNFATRYLVNDAAFLLGIPLVHGSLFRFEGQVACFVPGQGCYRCLYPEPPPPGAVPECRDAGVFAALPGVIGAIQATEVMKIITGAGRPLVGRLLLHDALAMTFRELPVRRDVDCVLCGDHPTVTELIDYDAWTAG